jgi:hypothetical protein
MFSLKSNVNGRSLTWRINRHKYLLTGGRRRQLQRSHTLLFMYTNKPVQSSCQYTPLCQHHVLVHIAGTQVTPRPLHFSGKGLHCRWVFNNFRHFLSNYSYLSTSSSFYGLGSLSVPNSQRTSLSWAPHVSSAFDITFDSNLRKSRFTNSQ